MNTTYNQTVTFDPPFATVPAVVVSQTGGAPHNADVSVNDISTTGFTVYVRRSSGTANTTVQWVAVA